MLETIREFAAERLAESGEEAELRGRHAAAFVALAERTMPLLESTDLVRALEQLDREDGNLRAALTWLRAEGSAELALRLVVALRNYWFIRGRLVEGCDTTLEVAALAGSAGVAGLRIDALNGAGFFAREYGNFDRAHDISVTALAECRQLGDRKREADALVNLGYVALQRGELDAARELFGACLDANRALGNGQGIADALAFLGLTAFYAGDLPTARQLNEESLALWEELGDIQAVVWARTRLGEVLLRQGEHERAFRELMDALTSARDLDFWWGFSWAFDGLAQLAAVTGAHRLAASLAAEAEAVRDDVGLRLPPTEKAEVDRLRHRLEREVGAEAFVVSRGDRGQRRVDNLIEAVRATLGFAETGPPGVRPADSEPARRS
jgi:tetratricopeptide (TPR) repeat protein